MDERVRAALSSAGFAPDVGSAPGWVLDGGTSRWVTVRATTEGATDVFTIDVEEWRGGEGYEAEELRTTSAEVLLVAIPRWAAWAREPWTKPTTWWGRLRAYFGLA